MLVPISPKFKKDIFLGFTGKIAKYMHPQPFNTLEDVKKFISDAIKENQRGENMQMVLLDKTSRKFMGCAGIHKIDTKYPELGIWLKKSAQGRGLGLEAVKSLKEWAEENLNYQYLYYPVEKNNIPSRRIPEKLGGKQVKEFAGKNAEGKEMIEVEYRIYNVDEEKKHILKKINKAQSI